MNTLGDIATDKLQVIVDRYNHHLKICSEYKKAKPEQNKAYSNKYFRNMKETEPEKYASYLARQKQYYNEVVKPKRQMAKTLVS